MKTLVVTILLFSVSMMHAVAVSRQESSGGLKKVVYSGRTTDCSQVVIDEDGYKYYIWAVVSVPEATLDNLSAISGYYLPYTNSRNPVGFLPMDRLLVIGSGNNEGKVYLLWKQVTPGIETEVFFVYFKIVVVYESGTTLGVDNSGTGRSLDLEWNTDEETAKKIRGYKVQRRERP